MESKIKVFIVDDHPIFRKGLLLQLKEIKIVQIVGEASNGLELIEYLKQNSDIDIILLDIKMPVMDGFEATRQIRSINKEVYIIAQSAYTQSDEMQRAIEAGCNDYIAKPIKIDEFYNIISQVTKRI